MNNANNPQEKIIDLASITADGDVFGAYFDKKAKITSVKLVNGAAIAQSDTNLGVVTLKNGSTSLAAHSTALTGGTSALEANVPAAMPLVGADVNGEVPVAAESYLKVSYDETGTYAMTSAKVLIQYYNL